MKTADDQLLKQDVLGRVRMPRDAYRDIDSNISSMGKACSSLQLPEL